MPPILPVTFEGPAGTCGCHCSKGVMNSNLDSKRGFKSSHTLQRNKKRRTPTRPHWERHLHKPYDPPPKKALTLVQHQSINQVVGVHGRIPEAVLPRGGRSLRMRKEPANPRTHHKNMHPGLRKPSEKQDENPEIALPELPGSPNGIAALTTFLQGSGAFTFAG